MSKMLAEEIENILKTLKKAGKHGLAECIQKNWHKTALAYSIELNAHKPKVPLEPEMLQAFRLELDRIEAPKDKQEKILASIEKRRVLQTAPHLGATESPRMLCINWLGSLGVPKNEYYAVAMYSGVPFSNRSRPGRINKKENPVNLFPSSLQDGLVYRSLIPKKLAEEVSELPKELRALLPRAVAGESYTKWAVHACGNIERKILGKENLIYLSINSVISWYLLQVLENKNHIFYKLFFDEKTRKEFSKKFPQEIMFYSPFMDGKYEKMESMVFEGEKLKSKHKTISLIPEVLIKELRENRLAPGLLPGFLALAFLNGFKCFGSFAQVEYLPAYQKKLAKLSFLRGKNIEKVPTTNLTTGVFPEFSDLYPVDIILGEKFSPNPNILFGELLVPMRETLLESYFTGSQRNKDK